MSLPEKANLANNESNRRINAGSSAGNAQDPKYGLLVTLTAKAGKQDQVAAILSNALSVAVRESGTVTWYAYRITNTKFGIFDTFNDEESRSAHLNGAIGKTLAQVSDELLDGALDIQALSIVTSKI